MPQPIIQKVKNIVLDIFFPALCLNCQCHLDQHSGNLVCNSCLASIKINSTAFCPICRARLPNNAKICHLESRYILGAAGNYNDPILQNLIHHFKYKGFKNLAPVLVKLMIEYIKNSKLNIESFAVLPIPLHPSRERRRGFNQAELLGKFLTDNFRLKMALALERIKNNKPQAGLKDTAERKKNMENCFVIQESETIYGKNILLVDDVFTSGATMDEAAKVLKSAGAKKIMALVLAKA